MYCFTYCENENSQNSIIIQDNNNNKCTITDNWQDVPEAYFSDKIETFDTVNLQPNTAWFTKYQETENEYLFRIDYRCCPLIINKQGVPDVITLPNIENSFYILHLPKDDSTSYYMEYFSDKNQNGIRRNCTICWNYQVYSGTPELLIINLGDQQELPKDFNTKLKKYLIIQNNRVIQSLYEHCSYLENIRPFKFLNIVKKPNGMIVFFQFLLNNEVTCYQFGVIPKQEIKDTSYEIVKPLSNSAYIMIDNKEAHYINKYAYKSTPNYVYLKLMSAGDEFDIKIDRKNKEKTICMFNNQSYEVSFHSSLGILYIKLFSSEQTKKFPEDHNNILICTGNGLDISCNNKKIEIWKIPFYDNHTTWISWFFFIIWIGLIIWRFYKKDGWYFLIISIVLLVILMWKTAWLLGKYRHLGDTFIFFVVILFWILFCNQKSIFKCLKQS